MAEEKENLITRAPVIVVLGHIDHGKTTLLDKIRETHVAEREKGGITQHIGAYEVEFQGKKITFIDTPGHEAFSAMRARGAKVADIAILVIDGAEGVKNQTKEAISHIQESGIPMIIAINKIDRPEADPNKVKRELAQMDISVESMGGDIPSVSVSGKTGKGISDLLELILLVSEMEDLKVDLAMPAEGVIIESYLDSRRGSTATLVLTNGILKRGDVIGTKSTCGKIKIMEDFQGGSIKEALPSMPVIILGFENVPKVGEKIRIFANLESAKASIKPAAKKEEIVTVNKEKNVLNLILKTDVLGSIEPIREVLKNLPQEKICLNILKAEVGNISESDVKLARSTNARILGFRVKIDSIARALAERDKIRPLTFDLIYDLVEGIRKLMERLLTPEVVRTDLGKMKTLVIFWTEKNRQIVGGRVTEGEITKGVSIEVFRNEEKIGQGRLISLQINKKEVERAIKGQECGILYEGDVKIEEGDVLVIYKKERKKPGTLE